MTRNEHPWTPMIGQRVLVRLVGSPPDETTCCEFWGFADDQNLGPSVELGFVGRGLRLSLDSVEDMELVKVVEVHR